MPTYAKYPGLCAQSETVTYHFRFQINGTSDPDFLVGCEGQITDIVYVSAGLFDVVLADGFKTLVSCHVSVEDDADMHGQPVSWTQSTKKLRIATIDVDLATAAQADPTDDKWVHVTATFCRRDGLAPSVAI